VLCSIIRYTQEQRLIRQTSIKQKIFLIVSGLLLSIIILEIGLCAGGRIILSLQEYRNKISIKQKKDYRILCLGESTTTHGGNNSYPRQLERILNERDIEKKFEVINKGRGGTNTTAIVSTLEWNINKYNPDMIIVMMGINDGVNTLTYEDTPFQKIPAFLKSFKIYKLARLLYFHILYKIEEKKMGIPEIKRNFLARKKELVPTDNSEKNGISIGETSGINSEKHLADIELNTCHKGQGHFNRIESMLKKALIKNPQNYNAYIMLGECYHDRTICEKAEEMHKKAIEINPRMIDAYKHLADCYRYQGKFDKAELILKRAIEINPTDEKAYIDLGKYYRIQGKYKKAEDILKKAVKINPKNNKTYEEILILSHIKISKIILKKENEARLKGHYPSITIQNYRKLKELVLNKGIKLVVSQYPNLNLKPLRDIFKDKKKILFIDNEKIFNEAISKEGFAAYFKDRFGKFNSRESGHCTDKGYHLLAENIANIILNKYFKN